MTFGRTQLQYGIPVQLFITDEDWTTHRVCASWGCGCSHASILSLWQQRDIGQ